MKILIATGLYPPEIGGTATYAKQMEEELSFRGIEALVLPFSKVRHLPKFLRHLAYFFEVIKRGRDCDIIFVQDTVSTGFPVICASFFIRKKVVLRVPGDHAWEQARGRFGINDSIDDFQNRKYSFRVELFRILQRFSVKYADVVITPSKYFSNLVRGWLEGKKEITTVYNGVDLKIQFDKKDKFGENTIISAGRLVSWKGFDVLIKSLTKLDGWRLIIAGDGPDKDRLEKIALEFGVRDRVSFLGILPKVELFENIYRSHIFALLATFESFSFQVVEAMFVGTPVIGPAIGNLEEIIENGKDGILVNPLDIDAFVREVNHIYGDIAFRQSLVSNAKLKAEHFSFEKTIDNLISIFNKLTK